MACKQKGSSKNASSARALYVHVPLCRSKCHYCDFYSLPLQDDLAEAYVAAAAGELAARSGQLALPVSSLFIGGGTPTALAPAMLERLLGHLSPLTGPDTEMSIEANPCTIDAPVARALVAGGVTRVSLGVQSFDDGQLAWLGRAHRAGDAIKAIGTLAAAGIEHLSIDLIYGLPGQDDSSWRQSVAQALDLGIEHLSCYALSVEAGTPLAAAAAAGQMSSADERTQKQCYLSAIELTRQAGWEHYELSNFARPGCQCHHNLTYWHNQPYLGIGPAAASYLDGWRCTNAPDLPMYVAGADARGVMPGTFEHLCPRGQQAETLMLGLRLIEGVSRELVTPPFARVIDRYVSQGALLATDTHVRIAPEHYFAADTILADIVAQRVDAG